MCKQGPLQNFVCAYLFNGTYSNLHRDRDPTSVVLELPELIEVVRIYLDAQVRKQRIWSVTHTRRLLRAWIFFWSPRSDRFHPGRTAAMIQKVPCKTRVSGRLLTWIALLSIELPLALTANRGCLTAVPSLASVTTGCCPLTLRISAAKPFPRSRRLAALRTIPSA